MSSDGFAQKSMKRKNVKGLALNAPPTPVAESRQQGGLQPKADTLEIGVEFRLDLRSEDLQVLKELGAGNGGTVSKVMHTATRNIMARKIIHVEARKEIRKRIVRELGIMHECNSDYIVSFFGAFLNDSGDVVMCMEYMDVGSLDSISKNFGPVRVDVLGKIAVAILGGLTYLYKAHKIMHRDIKPSNVLVNKKGQVKLCDFGVSSELEGSVADTFVGTGTYMAPERIQGSAYTVKSDVWSVGLTLMELAIGKFPFDTAGDEEDSGPQGILDLLQQIVLEPAPRLPKSEAFPEILEKVIAKCLEKDPTLRPTPDELYTSDAFLIAAKRTPVDLQAWALSVTSPSSRNDVNETSTTSTTLQDITRTNQSNRSSVSTTIVDSEATSRLQDTASSIPPSSSTNPQSSTMSSRGSTSFTNPIQQSSSPSSSSQYQSQSSYLSSNTNNNNTIPLGSMSNTNKRMDLPVRHNPSIDNNADIRSPSSLPFSSTTSTRRNEV